MQVFSKLAFTALLFGSSMVNGHMIMKTPKPFGNPSNSPLDPSGSDFPCKGGPYDRSSVQNVMAIGQPQTLSFTGSAVHGGGSCQVSLTTDLNPTASSKWMVIKSIEGGCPASVAGNLPADPNGSGASTFQYTIPEGIAPGEYVIAWSWINKIGNREFYMNCGPATITGAQKKRYAPAGVSLARRQSTFPDMFVANIKSVNSCTTPETFDYNYPNPGAVVQSAGTGPYTALACGGGGNNAAPQPTGAAGGSGSGSGSGSKPSSAPGTVPTGIAGGNPGSGSQPSGGQAQPTGGAGGQSGSGQGQYGSGQGQSGSGQGGYGQGGHGGQGGQGGQGATRTGAPGTFATGVNPLPSQVGSAQPAPPAGTGSTSPAAGGSSSAAGAQAAGSACSTEGNWLCLPGGTTYQRCGSGRWTPVQSVAAGLQCAPGNSPTIQMSRIGGAKYKRQPVRLAA